MKKTAILIILCLMIIISGCTKKEVEEKVERNIYKEFEGKNTLTCKAENKDKKDKTKYTTYIFEFDENGEKLINDVGFEESIYVGADVLESKKFEEYEQWYKTTYCIYDDDCSVKVIADNRIKTSGKFSINNYDNIFLSKTKEEIKKGMEDSSLDPLSNPYTCE